MSDLPIEAIVACDAEVERLRARVAELEADNADTKRLVAEELAETFKLFGILGLNEADDFGTKTAIEAVHERIESIKAERDRWKAEANQLPFVVRHVNSGSIVAAFSYPDIAQGWIQRGYQIGHWQPKMLRLEPARAANEEVEQ